MLEFQMYSAIDQIRSLFLRSCLQFKSCVETMSPTVTLLIATALLFATTAGASINLEAVAKKAAEALKESNGKVDSAVKAAGDALIPPHVKAIGSIITDAVNSIVGDEGTITVHGRTISYRFWGGMRGFRGWFWYGRATDAATGIEAGSGGPDHRCRGRQCAVEEAVKNLFTELDRRNQL